MRDLLDISGKNGTVRYMKT